MATHIIASTLPPKKSVDFNRYRIVKPAWIMDSVNASKLLPWADYRVLDEGPRQKVLKFDGGKGLTQSSPQTKQGYREQTDSSFYTSQFKSASLPSEAMSQVVERLQTPGQPTAQVSNETPTRVEHSSNLDFETPRTTRSEETKSPWTANRLDEPDATDESSPLQAAFLDEGSGEPKAPESLQNMTSEEHNALLLADPRMRKSSTANPDFIKQYYTESRLHHLSTWKAELKSNMQRLAADKGLAEKKVKRKPGARNYIMHVDFDSFFCAVSLKRHPDLIDKPVVVAHGTGTGSEIASCNYPARKFGVKNGMWMKRALELCPDIKVLPYDFPAYEDASRLFYECILDIGGVVQSVSIDEALVDATSIVHSASGSQGLGMDEGSVWREQEKVDELATTLREKIRVKTGCKVSVGIGGNILQAKVALRKAKPAGQYQLKPDDVLDIIGELKVDELPGVAYSIGGKLEEIGVKLVKDIRNVSKERLTSILGPKTSEKLRDYSRGIDKVEVGEQSVRKSVSAEVNWGIRFITQQEAEEFVYNLCKELERRLVNEQVRGKQLTMKIMKRSVDAPLDPPKHLGHGKCDVFNKSTTFGVATHSYEATGKEAVSILRSFKFTPGDLRGLGVQMTKLEPIKTTSAGTDGSQKKLTFGNFTGPSPARKTSRTEPIDEVESPQKSTESSRQGESQDPIADDPLTPRKYKLHPAMTLSKAGQEDAKARTPLNVSGTQFIIPSNPDPAVLAELPSDIRSKLVGNRHRPGAKLDSPANRSRSGSPMAAGVLPSQVDAEVFNALPDDMKAEVLASYGRKAAQSGLQQASRRDHVAQTKPHASPTKRGGIRNMFGKSRQKDSQAGLVQTNFKAQQAIQKPAQEDDFEELDPEFLAELPEDVRKEVVADHRRRRLAHRSGLDAPSRQHHNPGVDSLLPGGQRKIEFTAPPPKVSFASSGVSSTQEIKDMLDAWHSETRVDGPHRGDVEVCEKYMMRVVEDERDMEKVVKLVTWLELVVEQDGLPGKGQQTWRKSVQSVKDAVQTAVRERGFAPLNI